MSCLRQHRVVDWLLEALLWGPVSWAGSANFALTYSTAIFLVIEQGSGLLMPMPLPMIGRASVVTDQGRLLPYRIAHNALARTKRAHSRQQKGMVITAASSSEVHRFAISPPGGEPARVP